MDDEMEEAGEQAQETFPEAAQTDSQAEGAAPAPDTEAPETEQAQP